MPNLFNSANYPWKENKITPAKLTKTTEEEICKEIARVLELEIYDLRVQCLLERVYNDVSLLIQKKGATWKTFYELALENIQDYSKWENYYILDLKRDLSFEEKRQIALEELSSNNFNNIEDLYQNIKSWLVSWDFPTFWSFRWLYFHLTWKKINYFSVDNLNYIAQFLWWWKYVIKDCEENELIDEQEIILDWLISNWYSKTNFDLYMLLKNSYINKYYKKIIDSYSKLAWDQEWIEILTLDKLDKISQELWLEVLDFSDLFTSQSLKWLKFSKEFSRKIFYKNDSVETWVKVLRWVDIVNLYIWTKKGYIIKSEIKEAMQSFWKLDLVSFILSAKRHDMDNRIAVFPKDSHKTSNQNTISLTH